MQFVFGMLMAELIIKFVMMWVRMWLWLGKFVLRTSWRGLRLAVRHAQAAIEMHRSARAFRAASEKRSGL
ncbi:MAG: hypothetical protein ACYC0P_03090 [Thiobacillus sp.]